MLFASLSTRGAGFLISLLIARLAGASALGVYSALVNTVASVTTPFTQVLTNNATLLGAEGARSGGGGIGYLPDPAFLLHCFCRLFRLAY